MKVTPTATFVPSPGSSRRRDRVFWFAALARRRFPSRAGSRRRSARPSPARQEPVTVPFLSQVTAFWRHCVTRCCSVSRLQPFMKSPCVVSPGVTSVPLIVWSDDNVSASPGALVGPVDLVSQLRDEHGVVGGAGLALRVRHMALVIRALSCCPSQHSGNVRVNTNSAAGAGLRKRHRDEVGRCRHAQCSIELGCGDVAPALPAIMTRSAGTAVPSSGPAV